MELDNWTPLALNDWDHNRYWHTLYTEYKGQCAGPIPLFAYGQVNKFADNDYEGKVYCRMPGSFTHERRFATLQAAKEWVEYLYQHNDVTPEDKEEYWLDRDEWNYIAMYRVFKQPRCKSKYFGLHYNPETGMDTKDSRYAKYYQEACDDYVNTLRKNHIPMVQSWLPLIFCACEARDRIQQEDDDNRLVEFYETIRTF